MALRILVVVGYQPALFSPDSYAYVEDSSRFAPPALWPAGYPWFVALVQLGQEAPAAIAIAQHLIGLGTAVLLYALLLRLGAHRVLAAVATIPVCLDAYQLDIEHYVLSDTLFELLLVGIAAALLWRRPLGTGAAVLAGVLVAAAALTRVVGLLTIVPALLAVVFLTWSHPVRVRLLRAGVLLGAFAVLVGAYAVWYDAEHGSYALAGSTGRRLYGRVVPWVDCARFTVPRYERVLCPTQPVGERPRVYRLVWLRSSPLSRIDVPPGKTRSGIAGDFARRAIRGQPLAYARTVFSDFLNGFAPTKEARLGGYRATQWQFQTSYPIPGFPPTWSTAPPSGPEGGDPGHVRTGPASALRFYQQFGYVPGPVLALALALALLAALGVRTAASGLRTATFLFAGLAVAVCLGAVLVVPFSWRYQLPQLVLLAPAAALALTAMRTPSRASATARRDPIEPGRARSA